MSRSHKECSTVVVVVDGDAVVLLTGQQTCNSYVAGSSPGWAPLHSGLWQATYTYVPVNKQYNLVLANGTGDLFD